MYIDLTTFYTSWFVQNSGSALNDAKLIIIFQQYLLINFKEKQPQLTWCSTIW